MTKRSLPQNERASRRDFIRASSLWFAGGAVGGGLAVARAAHAFGSDVIKIGLIGCGTRGTAAAVQALNTARNTDRQPNGSVQLVALGDVFADRLHQSYRTIKGRHAASVDAPAERQFAGFDAYQRVLDCDVDLVLLATPPAFRPLHFEAAVQAGKHVFLEKPLATDPAGVRRVLAANAEAKPKGLLVAVGLQRRHERRYQETIRRLWDGAIGEILILRVYWNSRGVAVRPRQPRWTELEYKLRNWGQFNWLSGDHIVEQHIHNLDVGNWLLRAAPVQCNGQGGRAVRATPTGDVFDQHFVEYTYASGVRMFSQCRHVAGCWDCVAEHAHGTAGSADISGGKIYDRSGSLVWSSKGSGAGQQAEQDDLFAALRRGQHHNEADDGAASTLTAILGRMASYSGQVVQWEEALQADLPLADVDRLRSLADAAPVQPDQHGQYAAALPGAPGQATASRTLRPETGTGPVRWRT